MELSIVDFKALSDYGIVVQINKLLHPLGLSVCYDNQTGTSAGAVVSDALTWVYTEELVAEGDRKFAEFMENRETILKGLHENENGNKVTMTGD